jgi:hypothetical protein
MEYGEHGQCEATAKTTGERCKRPAVGEHGKCDKHGGEGSGPNDTAYLEGNDHAEGNPGSRPPEGNQNALSTGLHADPVNLFNWLLEEDRDAAVWILNKLHGYSQDAPRPVYVADMDAYQVDSFEDVTLNLTSYGDDVLLMCIRDYARWRATKQQLQDGILKEQIKATDSGPVSVEDSNPVNLDLDRMDKTTIRQKDKLGLLPGSSPDLGDDMQSLAEMWAEQLEADDE